MMRCIHNLTCQIYSNSKEGRVDIKEKDKLILKELKMLLWINLDTFEHLKSWVVDLMCPPLVEVDVDKVKNAMDAIENAPFQ